MRKLSFRKAYTRLVHSLKKSLSVERAMQQAIGGQFAAFGVLEREILIQYGLILLANSLLNHFRPELKLRAQPTKGS